MEIKVFGPGCKRCIQAEETVKAAVSEIGIQAAVTKVSDMSEIAKAGIISTPAVMIDGVVMSTGVVPTLSDVKNWLSKRGGCSWGEDRQ